jgi:hypothetical protein
MSGGNPVKQNGLLVVAAVLLMTIASMGCKRPQELPVVVSRAADGNTLEWRDAYGPLRGEVPWVLRTDVLGPDTFLVVETEGGDRCARVVSFRVLAAGVTEYTVTLTSDLHGNVSWRVTYGAGKRVKLFSCSPRPADDPRQDCISGGIPKPLFGELVGGISADLVGGEIEEGVRAVRFERGFPCGDRTNP